jgi:hypothetical protein
MNDSDKVRARVRVRVRVRVKVRVRVRVRVSYISAISPPYLLGPEDTRARAAARPDGGADLLLPLSPKPAP